MQMEWKQCRPWSGAVWSESALFAQTFGNIMITSKDRFSQEVALLMLAVDTASVIAKLIEFFP